jgi:hypothetical protein
MKPTFQPLPIKFVPLYRVRHLHKVEVHSGNLVELGILSNCQPVRKYAWLRYVAQNQN